ncbi:MAG: RDD family protein [Phycisphaerales bacterium]
MSFASVRLCFVWCASILIAAFPVLAGDISGPWLPSASSPWMGRADLRSGHGWFITSGEPLADGRPQYALMHLPPRRAISGGSPGTLRLAARVGSLPDALAAWEGQVWLIFPPDARGETGLPRRRVAHLELLVSAVAGEFVSTGGLATKASLEHEGDIEAAAGTSLGPLVILRQNGRAAMMLLRGSEWRPVRVPDGLSPPASGVGDFRPPGWIGASPGRRGPVVAWVTPAGDLRVALGTLRADPDSGITADWDVRSVSAAALSLPRPDGPELSVPVSRLLLHVDGQTIVAERSGPMLLRLFCIPPETGAAVLPLASLEVPEPHSLTGIDGIGRLASVWVTPTGGPTSGPAGPLGIGAPARDSPGFQIAEFSAFTGHVLHKGPASGKLFAAWQLQVLVVVISLVVVALLLFVLRSEADTSVPLPEGLALAPPGRRLAAAAIDFVIPTIFAAAIHDAAPSEILAIPLSGRSPAEWFPLATLAGILLGTTILQEWVTGRTLGKRLMGLGVLGYRQPRPGTVPRGIRVGQLLAGPPTLVQSTIRNVLRWLAWPTTVLILLDPNRRHPGDVLSRTVVVTRAESPGEED